MSRYVVYGSVRAVRETEKALLCEFPPLQRTVWVPKKVVDPFSEVREPGQDGDLAVCPWFSREVISKVLGKEATVK